MKKGTRTPKGTDSPVAGSNIVVTAQQSRFHADAVDAPESKEIDVKDVTISIGGRELLEHTHLRIREAVHYVLVGRNGTGKSTLMKALAERRISGVSWNMRILLLGQTRVDTGSVDDIDEESKGDRASSSVLEHVIRSNTKRERALYEAEKLSAALEDSSSTTRVNKVVRQLRLGQLERELAESNSFANRRSGARGAKARQAALVKEKEVEDAKSRLEQVENAPNNGDGGQEEVKDAMEMLEEVRLSLEAMDAGATEAKARKVLLGLGFPPSKLDQPYHSLSGGWRTRCDLASALTQQTDLLLLDEPTNFLDLPAIIWLQHFITIHLPTTSVIVVTHDRDFADAVAEELIVLRLIPAKSIETFKGNLSTYEHEKRKEIRRFTRMKEAQEKKTKHMEDSIANNLRAAKRTGDDKKLKQAVSRKKKLEERTGLEVSKSGGRFKLNRDHAGWQDSLRAGIEIPELDPPVSISFPGSPTPLRFPGPLVSFEKVSYKYPKTKDEVLEDVDLIIHPGERVGIAGLNGSGKSTLIKLLMGAENGGSIPTKGIVTKHSKARIEHYSQHAVEELEALGMKDSQRTALSHLLEVGGGELTEQEARAILGQLGLRGNFASDVPLRALSGGQRVRLAIAQVVWSAPHLLVLDEVTTHLDSDTVIALAEALADWSGALLVVTHDRFFMRCVVEQEAVDVGSDSEDEDGEGAATQSSAKEPGVVYRLRNGMLKKLEGGMQKYEELVEKSVAKLGVL